MNRPLRTLLLLAIGRLKKSKETQKRIFQLLSYPNNRVLSFHDDSNCSIDIFRCSKFRLSAVLLKCMAQHIRESPTRDGSS